MRRSSLSSKSATPIGNVAVPQLPDESTVQSPKLAATTLIEGKEEFDARRFHEIA
jgi:hypothetical protein